MSQVSVVMPTFEQSRLIRHARDQGLGQALNEGLLRTIAPLVACLPQRASFTFFRTDMISASESAAHTRSAA